MSSLLRDEIHSTPLPPQRYVSFGNARFQLYQLLLNPGKTRSILVKKIKPAFFTSNPAAKKPRKGRKVKVRKMRKIDKGGFGAVYSANCVLADGSKERCAVKKLLLANGGSKLFNSVHKAWYPEGLSNRLDAVEEIHTLEKLRGHDFIVNYIHSWEKRSALYIVMDLCELGDLSGVLSQSKLLPKHNIDVDSNYCVDESKKQVGCIPVDIVRLVMAPIFDAVAHMHKKGYIHRDIKPQNIVINKDGVPKLCDFGTCVYIGKSLEMEADPQPVGSSYYMAPETVLKAKYNRSIDTWSLGISMLVLVYGWGPYHFRKKKTKFEGAGDRENPSIEQAFKEAERQLKDGPKDLEGRKNISKLVDEYFHDRLYLECWGQKLSKEQKNNQKADWRDFWAERKKNEPKFMNFMRKVLVFATDLRRNPEDIAAIKYCKEVTRAWREGFSALPEKDSGYSDRKKLRNTNKHWALILKSMGKKA